MSNTTSITVERVVLGIVLVLICLGLPTEGQAQVGHPPGSSPYSDLKARRVLSFIAGYLDGSTGKANVGPGDGPFGGIRFDLHLSGPASATFGTTFASLDRVVIDPTVGPDDRVLETTTQSVLMLDAGIDINLTGEKSWNRMIPYIGGGLGMALGGKVRADSVSGFSFSSQFMTGPRAGIWWHPTDRVTFRFEARDIIWRLRYPDGFFSNPENAPGEPSVLDPETTKETQWVHHLGFSIAVGWSIGR
ncbi:MAG: hypothetical protein QNJ97_28225 [Myxococcota bacterium]|nr:hypothetical protein [Myxococcota bacterium]